MQPEILAQARRCLARTRSGKPCQSPAVAGRKRCRMHGGTNPGAPKGNQHNFKHGRYSAEAIKMRRYAAMLRRQLKALDRE